MLCAATDAEALYQLALFPAGKDALLSNPAAVAALQAVEKRGMTHEAMNHACGALSALHGFKDPSHEAAAAPHIMLSYQWVRAIRVLVDSMLYIQLVLVGAL